MFHCLISVYSCLDATILAVTAQLLQTFPGWLRIWHFLSEIRIHVHLFSRDMFAYRSELAIPQLAICAIMLIEEHHMGFVVRVRRVA
uniref:Putative secreted protein n=1 Tax=Ixodes ricinus TaxID=34613 RepID=A0A6B0U9I7_IXORI